MKPSKFLATILVVALAVLMMTSVAFAAITVNDYGKSYNQTADCGACHDVTVQTVHSTMVTNVVANPGSLIPSAGVSGAWPSVSPGNGIRFMPANVYLMIGGKSNPALSTDTNYAKEYVGIPGSTLPLAWGPSNLTTVPAVAPADDFALFDPIGWSTDANAWEPEGTAPVGVAAYFQRCGGCHNVAVTRPGTGTQTLAWPSQSGAATMTASTPTTQTELSIGCENCHGTGINTALTVNHKPNITGIVGFNPSNTGGNGIVASNKILDSQVCGQCHVTGSANETNFAGAGKFSSPNGFTTDQTLTAGFTPKAPTASATNPANPFWPDQRHGKSMKHEAYNEWLLTGHAATHGGPNSHFPQTNVDTQCYKCHSGEGHLGFIAQANTFNSPSIVPAGTLPASGQAKQDAECAVCHAGHVTNAGEPVRKGSSCADCHNWQYQVLNNLAQPTAATIATGAPVDRVSHPTAQMRGVTGAQNGAWGTTETATGVGYGLIDVAPNANPWMADADCAGACHMPKVSKSNPAFPSHAFLPMQPGNAQAYGVLPGGDSCTPCHGGASLDSLQTSIDSWQTQTGTKTTATNAALTRAALSLGFSGQSALATSTSTVPAIVAAKVALFDLRFVTNDGSTGVHNFPYATAGLDLAKKYADAVGGNITGAAGAMIVRSGDSLSFVGVASNGSTVTPFPAGATVVIQKSTNGGTTWSNVTTTTTDASGGYQGSTGAISGATSFRAMWIVRSVAPMFTITSIPFDVSVGTGGGIPVYRVWGSSRYGTAVMASQSTFSDNSVHNIVVATGQNFPDALSASGLAGTVGSPILLINKPGDALPADVLAEIARISSKNASGTATSKVWFIGGSGVLPNVLMTEMMTAIPGITTTRVAGDDRYGTSAAVADAVHTVQGGAWTGKGFVAVGTTFPDALSAGAVAYGKKWPVLLTKTALPTVISNVLKDEDFKNTYVVGGAGVIPESVLTSIRSITASPSITASRVAGGATRYETAATFGVWAITSGNATPGYVGIATGQNFPDALGAAGPIGTNGGVLLLTKGNALDASAAAFLTNYRAQISKSVIFGGPGVVNASVFEQVSTILNP